MKATTRFEFEVVEPHDLPALESFEDWSICQTPEWINFVAETQNARPVYAAVVDTASNGEVVGRYACLTTRRLGVTIAGAPMRGWTTQYMGANLRPSVPREAILEPLIHFAHRALGAVHVEFMDRDIDVEGAVAAGMRFDVLRGFEIDLTQSEDELFAAMSSSCRRAIRKAEKVGVTIEEATDVEFADDYFVQLEDVFAKQKLVPTYDAERVRALLRNLMPTGRLLALRARDSEGRCIATGIFPASDSSTYFWGGASFREHQHNRPNEALLWYAMRYWKARGVKRYDFGGSGEYKRKYGGQEIAVPWIRRSRVAGMEQLRSMARGAYRLRQRAAARRG